MTVDFIADLKLRHLTCIYSGSQHKVLDPLQLEQLLKCHKCETHSLPCLQNTIALRKVASDIP